ncbi:MAG: hypothetical protein ACYTGQ_04705, partial [Planctomycetota bacterium]
MSTIEYDRPSGTPLVDDTVSITVDRPPQVIGESNFTTVTTTVCQINEGKTPVAWYVGFAIALSLLALLGGAIGYLFTTGVGV